MPISNQPSTKPSPRPPVRRTKFALAAAGLLSFIGFLDAVYLTLDHFLKLPLPCNFTNGCDTVLTSQFATVNGIPVALFGALYYLAVLFLAVFLYTSEQPNRRIARLILLITTLAVIVSGYLFYLQASVIHAFCMYCLGSATTTLLLFLSSIFLVAGV
jgi:uncharacterized membrane protein